MNFTKFFQALWNQERFPWQKMLAERGANGDWPEAINLPTASGKTACIDAALFALAATASGHAAEKRMPRRIWFVVDRRIVVDEAFERAKKIAKKLASATEGPVKEVADRLLTLSGTGQPLAVARLRGGAWRDDGWAHLPSQPAVICSTVDQVGSALLFRAYGHGDGTASIFAGLAAHDSLILLDEAHCAVPFLETLSAVARFRDERWAERPLKTPFLFSIMSATPPSGIAEDATFPKGSERAAALDHPVLRQRFTARKLADFAMAKSDAEFVTEAVSRAHKFAETDGKPRVAVMVNRVLTAEQIAECLRDQLGDSAEVVLLTGRMRPLDRDTLVKRWESVLKAGSTELPPDPPVVVVTTQCLEVGADFSFDALVTECASLDALRQRFGRLDRFGALRETHAVILIREQHTKEPKDGDEDPIYGKAIYETWKWLSEPGKQEADGTVDFGVEAMSASVKGLRERDEERFDRLFAPTPDAPVLLPAHLDLLCQTSPRPTPDPDIALFLHGKGRGTAEVQVVLRADLPDPASAREAGAAWLDILSLVPPTSPEMWTVPLHRLRRWLAEGQPDDASGDVEGAPETSHETSEAQGQRAREVFFLWRGRDRSVLTSDPRRIRPGDVVVLRAAGKGLRDLGQTIAKPDGLGAKRLDLAERALRHARGRVMLRLQADVFARLRGRPSIARLLDLAATPETEHQEIRAALQAVLDEAAATADATNEMSPPASPDWLNETVKALLDDGFRIEAHPAGGLILTGNKQRCAAGDAETEDDPLADEEDLTSKWRKAVPLRQHTAKVCSVVSGFAARCLPTEFGEAFATAAQGHDLGKLDRRFQIVLRNGVEGEVETEPLAKSEWLPERRRRQIEVREDARLPKGFRHEFLSLQLAERFGLTPHDDDARDLALHLIASHHGYARPFAPVVPDPLLDDGKVADLSLAESGLNAVLTAAARQALLPAHRLDSGVADRFWRLTRCYGWWGLAYLEGIFRLADWQASRSTLETREQQQHLSPSPQGAAPKPPAKLTLDALDGANPLAFLAALGALRILTRVFPAQGLRLSWSQRLGAWRPLLWTEKPLDEEAVLAVLHETALRLDTMFSRQLLAASEKASPRNKKGEPRWKDKLLFPVGALREFCREATASPSVLVEFSATWAGETAPTGEKEDELARRTRFDFTAGPQAFIRMLRELRESCTPEDLRRALFTGWRYSATAVSMRWDPQDEKRQYALQAVDPTNSAQNPPLADLGANFLAVEALPLFPLVPDRWASQPGFDRNADGRCWRWPIWTYPLGLDAIRSLLALPLVDSEEWPAARRRAFGVSTVFQSGIVQPSGRYRCFTPAQSL